MPKLTLEQKRHETLRRQLYGHRETPILRRQSSSEEKFKSAENKTFSFADYKSPTLDSKLLTTNYLARDLTKILIFSVIAIGVQFSLFFLMQHNLLKLSL